MNVEEREPFLNLETNNKNKLNIRIGNIALDQIIKFIKPKYITLNGLTYSTEKAITQRYSMKKKNRTKTSHKQPAWKLKIQKEIEILRDELSILEYCYKGINTKIKKEQKVKIKYKLQNENDITTPKEKVKQKIQDKIRRIRRLEKKTTFYCNTYI